MGTNAVIQGGYDECLCASVVEMIMEKSDGFEDINDPTGLGHQLEVETEGEEEIMNIKCKWWHHFLR